jgi:hypothetical protein
MSNSQVLIYDVCSISKDSTSFCIQISTSFLLGLINLLHLITLVSVQYNALSSLVISVLNSKT